jgi:hypothetical protein
LPREQARYQEENIILYLYPDNYFEGNEEHHSKGQRMADGPKVSKKRILVPDLQILLDEHKNDVNIIARC